MRKIFFYFFILRKVLLLLVYPVFERKNKFSLYMRKNIEDFLIFQPSRLRARRIKRGLLKKINPQRFVNQEGIKLYAWFIKPKSKKPVFLHFHGQAESILSHQDVALFCLEKGYGLFMLSYRGHYKSGGVASERGVYNDAQAAILQLKKLGVDEDKIILWGHSLGSSVALETALNNNVMGVVLQCPIKEFKSAALGVFKFYCKKFKMPYLSKLMEKHLNKIDFLQKLDNITKIPKVKSPVLVVHSKGDKVSPCENSVELIKLNPNAQLYLSETGNHWDCEWCFERVCQFVENLNTTIANK